MKNISLQVSEMIKKKDFNTISFLPGIMLNGYMDTDLVLQDIGISPRVFNHWMEKEICGNGVVKKGKFFRFNFIEYVWLSIAWDLRDFNLSLDQIKKVRASLLKEIPISNFFPNHNDKQFLNAINKINIDSQEEKEIINKVKSGDLLKKFEKESIPLLFFNLLQIINTGHNIKLLIDSNCNVLMYDDFYFSADDIKSLNKELFITVPLIKYIEKLLHNPAKSNWIAKAGLLNENEIHILSLIREGKADNISIKFQDGKPIRMEIEKRKKQDVAARLSEILFEGGYQELTVKTQSGDITYTNIKTKINLK